jgi:hypothetical protein
MNDDESGDAQCPSWAVSLGYLGVASAVCLSNWGSAVSFLETKRVFCFPGCKWAPRRWAVWEKIQELFAFCLIIWLTIYSLSFCSGAPGNPVWALFIQVSVIPSLLWRMSSQSSWREVCPTKISRLFSVFVSHCWHFFDVCSDWNLWTYCRRYPGSIDSDSAKYTRECILDLFCYRTRT